MSSTILLENGIDILLGEDGEELLLEEFPPSARVPAVRWNRKPPEGTQLDPYHPSCPDYCWPFNSVQGTPKALCRSQPLTDPGSSSAVTTGWMVPGPSKYGLGVRHGATGDRTVLAIAAEADKVVGLTAFSLVIAVRKTDSTLRNQTIFGYDTNTTANRCQIHCPFNDGNVYFDYNSNRAQVNAGSFVAGDDLWIFTAGPRGQEIWQNGVLLATNATPSSRSTGGGGASGTVGFPANPGFSDLNDTSLIMTWTRQLTAAEVMALSVNPWQVFQPKRLLMAPLMSAEPLEAPSLWISLPRQRWTRKPVPGTQLDPNHPHCPDMCWPFLSPASTPQILTRNINPGTPTAPVGTPTWSQGGKYGLSMRHTANTDITRLCSTALQSDAIITVGTGFTVMLAYRKTDTTARPAMAWGVDGALGAANDANFYIDNNGGNTGFLFGGTALNISNASFTFGDDLWVFTTGPRGMEVWQNGILMGSNASNPSRTASLTTCINTGQCLVAWPAGQPNFSDLADMALIMTWRRQLSWAAIRDLYVNPWQVFQPLPMLFAGDVAPTGAGATSRFPALFLAP